MEIAKLVAKNHTILRLGLHLNVPDVRMRIAQHLQDNLDDRMSSDLDLDLAPFLVVADIYYFALFFTVRRKRLGLILRSMERED